MQCNAMLGFDPGQMNMLSLQPVADNDNIFTIAGTNSADQYKYCGNKQHNVCNWLLPKNSEAEYCIACSLNHTIPNLYQQDHWDKWTRIEVAKHRLVYSLLRFKLPVISKVQDEDKGIAFDFMEEENAAEGKRLLPGHDNGLITLNIEEADDVARVMARKQMDEVHRTLLGHFRHEIGHYYWEQLIQDSNRIAAFRKLFGDESVDYAEALKQHYAKAVSDEWREEFISTYASSHPWEDWAETWAHYLHIIDTLETAYSFGMILRPKVSNPENELSTALNIDPYATKYFDDIIERWIPLSFVMNSLNRSMGMKDSYPFVINEAVKQKLNFIHETIQTQKQL